MNFMYICALVCGAFIFVSADSSTSTSPSFMDNIQNEFQGLMNSVQNAVGGLEQTIQNGTSSLIGKKGALTGGLIDTIINTITNFGNQVANVFVAPINKGLNGLADGVVKTMNDSVAQIQKLQECANNEHKDIDISAPIQAVEKCAMDAITQATGVIDLGISNIEKIASDITGDITDALNCAGSFLGIFKCIGTVVNGGLRGAQDISNTATKGVQIGTGLFNIAPTAVGCMAGTINGIIQNVTDMGINVNKCLTLN